MRRLSKGLIAAALLAAAGITVHGSSHREALAILNEPCADNTDTYAWVSDGSHDKLYLIMNFNPLHEPGQGNQGLRACNGYRYEFHIGKGKSLKDRVVYRVEFTNRLKPEAAPSAADPLGGGNELLWQLTGGTETMKVTRIESDTDHGWSDGWDDDAVVLGRNLPVLPNNHGPQTDRLVYGLGPFKGYDSGDPTSREVGLYDQPFVDTFIHPLSNGGRVIAGQFDDPYQLDEKGIFDLVNLNSTDLGGIPGARRPPADRRVHGLQPLLDRARDADQRRLPERHPAQRPAQAELDRQPAARVVEDHPPRDADRRCRQHHHRPQGIRRLGAGGPQRPAALQRGPRRHAAPDALPAQQPDAAT